jgi:hypothetical protein
MVGVNAGFGATNASYSNFFGYQAGFGAVNAIGSNFFGYTAGHSATFANNSNFFGENAGRGAINASYSNFLGYNVANEIGVPNGNLGSNNIIIGTNISLPDATANAINIGGVLFGTGIYNTTTGNPSVTPSGGKIGIGVVNPQTTLDVAGTIRGKNLNIIGTTSISLPN